MLTYTVNSNQLAEEDIYEIRRVSSLAEFLRPQHSLCIVKAPYDGAICEMTRVTGKNRRGEPLRTYVGQCSGNYHGYIKCLLDKNLRSPFLFVSWKQRGCHVFRLVEKRQVLAEFPDFESALAAYFPDGFVPEKSYRRNHTVFELMCRAMKRKRLFGDLVTLLARWTEQRRNA